MNRRRRRVKLGFLFSGSALLSGPLPKQETEMSKKQLFVEQRPQGDYAVRKPNAARASAVAPTQAEAIEIARTMNPGHSPSVERVRHTSVGKPDQWRKA